MRIVNKPMSPAQDYLNKVSPFGGPLTDEQSRHYQELITGECPLITGVEDLADAIDKMAAVYPIGPLKPSIPP